MFRVVQPSPQFSNIFITPQRNPYLFVFTPSFTPTSPDPNLFSVYLPTLDTSYEWSRTTNKFCYYFLSLSMLFSRFIHIIARVTTGSFLSNRALPFYERSTSSYCGWGIFFFFFCAEHWTQGLLPPKHVLYHLSNPQLPTHFYILT
jgi:hypothetical protein